MVPVDDIIAQFAQVLARLDEALAASEKTTMARDSAILRFALTFDVSWKSLKAYLEDIHKVRCASPKSCFREAYNQKLLNYEPRWLAMADDRNAIAHMYKESLADAVYARLPEYLELFRTLLTKLKTAV